MQNVNELVQAGYAENVDMVLDSPKQLLSDFTEKSNIVSSIPISQESASEVFKVISSAEPMADNIGKKINVVNYVAQIVDFFDENGAVNKGIRTILATKDGKAYSTMSQSVIKALQTYLSLAGEPSEWKEPATFTISEEKSRRGFKFITLTIA